MLKTLLVLMNSGRNIPGYTGFIPFKSEFFGYTAGAQNKCAEATYRTSATKFGNTGLAVLAISGGDQKNRSSSIDLAIE